MKYYSDETHQFYDSAEECQQAEHKIIEAREAEDKRRKELDNARAEREKALEAAYKRYLEDYEEYKKLRREFNRDYSPYYITINSRPGIFDMLFN